MKCMSKGRPTRLRGQQSGTVAVEFAIVGVWLVVMLGAIIEAGLFLLVEFQLQNAADRMARLVRTNQLPEGTSVGTFKDDFCKSVRFRDCKARVHVDVRNASKFADLSLVLPITTGKPPSVGPEQTEVFEPGGANRVGSLIVTYDWTFVFPFMSVFSNQPGSVRRLYAISIFRNEE